MGADKGFLVELFSWKVTQWKSYRTRSLSPFALRGSHISSAIELVLGQVVEYRTRPLL